MFDDLLSLIFPEHCRGCNRSGSALCPVCRQSIPTARPVAEPSWAYAFFDYQDPLARQAVWELKYHRKSPLAKTLIRSKSDEIATYIAFQTKDDASMPIVIVPIPQHYSKTNQRGFNQSMKIGKWMAAALPTATLQPVLKKPHLTVAQAHTINKQERRQNVTGSMIAINSLPAHALYVLVDDVITTGSTAIEAGRALRAAGAIHICALALAHG